MLLISLVVASKTHLEPGKKRFKVKDMYLFYTHLLWQFAAAVAFIVYDSCVSPALTKGVTSLGGQQVEWLSHTGASRCHGTGAWASQHFVSNLPQPPTALWDCLPSHAVPTSLCLTPVSLRSRCAQLQAHKPRLFFTFLSPWPSRCVSFYFLFLSLFIWVWSYLSDIDFHFLSARPLPPTAHQ